ncbi:MAG: hypothetical protein ABIS67_10815 [Candidatus Eisenbacteria bacterium]
MKCLFMVAVCTALAAGTAYAHQDHKQAAKQAAPFKPSTQQVTVTGEIVDPQCWFTHDGQGAKHRSCAVLCARGGQDLAILDSTTGRLYSILGAGHGVDPNKNLLDHVAVPVRIKGTVYTRGPNQAIVLQSVVPLK